MRHLPKMLMHEGAPWVLCKARKQHLCILTRQIIYIGDLAYRPLTNGQNRMNRIKASRIKTTSDEGQS